MRAVAVTEFGGPEKLALIDAPVPQPAAGEALVEALRTLFPEGAGYEHEIDLKARAAVRRS